ncbi:MAG TPA: CpaD family pilus assembly lipoprotein [Alphaproteobacteria bacterium]|nr:CpaD family pilus assembly lipoprotein [Alphaproteobacteria bacterium]
MRAKLLLPFFALLAGCADFTTQWTPDDSPKAIRVDVARSSYEVRFAAGSASLGPAETTRLARFVETGGIRPQDRIALEQADALGKLAERRRDALLKALRTNGVGAAASVAMVPKVGRDRVVIEIERGVAASPPCPDWSKPPIDYSAQVSSNFGCATASNLAAMAADPTDLLHAQPNARAEGSVAAGAVQGYHDHQAYGAPQAPSPYSTDFYATETTSQ